MWLLHHFFSYSCSLLIEHFGCMKLFIVINLVAMPIPVPKALAMSFRYINDVSEGVLLTVTPVSGNGHWETWPNALLRQTLIPL